MLHLEKKNGSSQRVFTSDASREIYRAAALKMPSPSSQLKSLLLLLLLFCFLFFFLHSQSGLLPAHCDLTRCDGSSQPGREDRGKRGGGVALTHLQTRSAPWLVPDSGSLFRGTHRSPGTHNGPIHPNVASGPCIRHSSVAPRSARREPAMRSPAPSTPAGPI